MPPADEPAAQSPSAIGAALLLIGDQWNLLVLQQAFLHHVRRFADWRDALGLADSVLSGRLRELVAADVLAPAPYRTSGRTRTEYLLTDKGLQLWEFLVAIWSWEQTWAGRRDDRVRLRHLSCGADTVPVLGCARCGQAPVTARDTSVVTGPDITFGNVAVPRHHRRTVRAGAGSRADSFQLQTLEILGDRWSTVLLVAAFLRVRRFADFQQVLRIAPGVLSDRLARFVELDVLTQTRGTADREEYRLTAKGLDFFPVFAFLVDWAQNCFRPPTDGGLRITHRSCDDLLQPALRCAACHQGLDRRQVRFDLGQG